MEPSFSVRDILSWVTANGGRVANGSSQSPLVHRLSPLAESRAGSLAFFFSRAYQNELVQAEPSVLVTGEDFIKPMEAAGLPLWKSAVIIATRDPYLAMAQISGQFAEKLSTVAHMTSPSDGIEIHPSAVVDRLANLSPGVRVGANCVIEADVQVGRGTVFYPGCYVGRGVTIGQSCVFFPRVTLYEWAQVGNRVRVHAGAVIGADGFGYAQRIENGKPVEHQKIYHLGRVVIGDDVEIGANSCIDRGTVGDTKIASKAKIDNQVQVGHNCQIGEGAIICGCVGMAGSSSVGPWAMVGGLTGLCNQVHVGAGAKVGAGSLMSKDVEPGGTGVGNPQREQKEFFKVHAILSRMLAERQSRRKNPEKSPGEER